MPMEMKHPEALLLPLLMFADYLLTIAGAIWKDRGYHRHFKLDSYELNPVWQNDVARRRWFNPRHALLVLATSAALIGMFEFLPLPEWAVQAILGCFLVAFGYVVACHLSNLATFVYTARHPDQLRGEVSIDRAWLLAVSSHQVLLVLAPLVILAAISPTPLILGGIGGAVVLWITHRKWLKAQRKNAATRSMQELPVEAEVVEKQ